MVYSELQLLSEIAVTHPHAAYAALTHGLSSRWSYLSCNVPNMFSYYQQLENIICTIFIPTVTGQPPPSDTNRDMFVLPTRLGGLGLPNPSRQSDLEFSASQTISEPLKESILQQRFEYSFECLDDQISAKSLIKQKRQEQATRADKVLKISL